MIQKIKDLALPLAIVTGSIFHSFISKLNFLIPMLIFVMLYVTLCSIDIKNIRITRLHLLIIGFQISMSLGLFFILKPIDPILAQGALAIIVAPTAISAPVIAAMLGANLTTMVSSTLLSNIAVAIISPLYFSIAGDNPNISFFESSWLVLYKVAPLIIAPLLLALATQRFKPKLSKGIARRKNIPFFIWAFSLTIVIASTVEYIFKMESSETEILVYMALLSFLICALQFAFGRWIGKKHGDIIAGGQSVGQKNTVLAIWMAQTYLNPLSSVVPALYVLWQNLFNSYQLVQKSRKDAKK